MLLSKILVGVAVPLSLMLLWSQGSFADQKGDMLQCKEESDLSRSNCSLEGTVFAADLESEAEWKVDVDIQVLCPSLDGFLFLEGDRLRTSVHSKQRLYEFSGRMRSLTLVTDSPESFSKRVWPSECKILLGKVKSRLTERQWDVWHQSLQEKQESLRQAEHELVMSLGSIQLQATVSALSGVLDEIALTFKSEATVESVSNLPETIKGLRGIELSKSGSLTTHEKKSLKDAIRLLEALQREGDWMFAENRSKVLRHFLTERETDYVCSVMDSARSIGQQKIYDGVRIYLNQNIQNLKREIDRLERTINYWKKAR